MMVSKPVLIEMDPNAEKTMQVKQGKSMNKNVQVSDAWLWRTTGLWTAYIQYKFIKERAGLRWLTH